MSSAKKLIQVLAFLLFFLNTFSQKQKITGTITDASSGTPIDGSSIQIKSLGEGTVSNSQGFFTIEASPNDVLTITSVGYTTQSIPLNGQTNISVKLQQSATGLEQIVMVGSRSATGLEQIVMVGSRSGGRVKTES